MRENKGMDEKPKPRWLTFSLRALLASIFLLSIPVAWLGAELQQAERELMAIRELQQLDCEVYYVDREQPDGEILLSYVPRDRGVLRLPILEPGSSC